MSSSNNMIERVLLYLVIDRLMASYTYYIFNHRKYHLNKHSCKASSALFFSQQIQAVLSILKQKKCYIILNLKICMHRWYVKQE